MRLQRSTLVLLCALALATLSVAGHSGHPIPIVAKPAAALNGLKVSGNQLQDGSGNPIRFIGVNRSGSEYACIQGNGIFDGPADLASVQAILTWHVNAVRVPLNEDCWLGINQGSLPSTYYGANYQTGIVAFVNLLNANGIYVELSLIWGAPGANQATYQPNAPDQDHSPAFWTSVANTFKSNPNIVFGVWGETTVSWSCFLNGCSNEATYGTGNALYTTAGTQELVNDIRATGATQVISVPCINYANDCLDANGSWLTNEPTDSLHSLIAEAHIYGNNSCGAQSNGACLTNTIAPIAAQVPFFFGETGETYDDSECTSANMQVILPWADSHNVGYLAWTWDTWGNCDALISDYLGTPNTTAPAGAQYGAYVHSHFASLMTNQPTVTSVSPNTGASAGGTSVTITGTNFTGATAVKFGSTAAASFTVNSATSISATSPAGLGTVHVTVTTPSGTSATSSADQFTYTGAAATCYFNWYDRATAGMVADNIHLLNTSGSTAHYSVGLPGATALSATLAPGAEGYVNFPVGTIGGPVTVSSDQAFLATQRVQYFQSFNEVWCEKASQADTTLYMPWFDRATAGMVGDNIHVLNPGNTTAHVTLALSGQTSLAATVNGGAESYLSFPAGTIGGPVKITSDQPVLAAQRVQYFQTFNEEIAQSATAAQTTGYFNWFDKASAGMVGDNIHVVNPGTTTAHVTVNLAGQAPLTATISGGGTAYLSFPSGALGGPVKLTSDQAVLATQRVQYYQSFNEVPQAGAGQAATSLHVMWFDKATAGMVGDNIHLLNPGATTAHVTISLAGATSLSLSVGAGAEAYATFPAGTIGGPVGVSSDVAVLAAQRVQYYQTFNESAAS